MRVEWMTKAEWISLLDDHIVDPSDEWTLPYMRVQQWL